MPVYEAKYQKEDEWVEISDIEIMDELYKTFTKATPAIKEMIMGKEIETPYRIYRLK
jgi:predicted alternative tryptophan synthase beta-subunit